MSKPTYGEMRTRAERIADQKVKDAVLAGLSALQAAHGDGWVEEINCRSLNLAHSEFCVLGQIYGEYEDGVEAMCGRDGAYDHDWAVEHGFNTDGSFDVLDDAWHVVLCDKEAVRGGAS